jgi:hypothetical protein
MLGRHSRFLKHARAILMTPPFPFLAFVCWASITISPPPRMPAPRRMPIMCPLRPRRRPGRRNNPRPIDPQGAPAQEGRQFDQWEA